MRFRRTEPVSEWRTQAILDRGILEEACLALDGQGQGSAVWGNQGELWTMPIGPRSSPALVRLPLGEGTTPRIVLNPDGRGIALWQAEVSGERQIVGKILGGDEGMGHVIFRTAGRVRQLQAAVDRRGNALVVWLLATGGQFEVMAQSFDTRGLAWEQAPTTLGVPSSPGVEPRLAVNHREHAMVLWEVEEGGSEGLVASHFWPAERIWSDRPVPVVSHATRQHQVVMDDMGNALALWIHAPYGQRRLLEASYYDAHRCEWGKREVLSSSDVITTPRLVMSGDGEALAAWCQEEGHGTSRLYARAFMKGNWGAKAECLSLGQGSVRDFAIGLGSDGQAGLIAVHGGLEGDWVSARRRKVEWSAPVHLVTASPQPCSSPRLAICPHGVSALWIQGEGRDKSLILTETR
jgi:hypothetical protein